jgi:hypothetical protein
VYKNLFGDHQTLNFQLPNLTKSTRNYDEILEAKYHALAVDANTKNKMWVKYFDEDEAPLVTMEMI